jgi:hypothetical protein
MASRVSHPHYGAPRCQCWMTFSNDLAATITLDLRFRWACKQSGSLLLARSLANCPITDVSEGEPSCECFAESKRECADSPARKAHA